MAKDRRQLSREQIREYLKKSDEEGKLDADLTEDKDLKQLAKSKETPSGKRRSAKDRLGNTISTMTKVTGNFTGTIAGTFRAEFESNEFKNRVKAFGLGIAVVVICLVTLSILPIDVIEKPLHDAKMKLRPFDPPETEAIMHLDIDNKSISTVGRWPWNRDQWAAMLYGAKASGIERVIFDVEFFDPQSNGNDPVRLAALREKARHEQITQADLDATEVNYDQKLSNAIAETGNVYMAMHFNRDGNAFRNANRTIAWNGELFEALATRIDERAALDGLVSIGREEMKGLLTGLSGGGVEVSEALASKAVENELTTIQAFYCYRRTHAWYAAHQESIEPHMQGWLKDWYRAKRDRIQDIYPDYGNDPKDESPWAKPLYDQLQRAYSWYRFIDGRDFGDTPWVLPPTAIEGYRAEDYDAWQVQAAHDPRSIPFYNDFEFVPALFQMLAHSRGVGFVSIEHDKDGTVREVPLFALYRDTVTKHDVLVLQLAFFVLLRETKADFSSLKIQLGSHISFRADPKLMASLQAKDAVSVPPAGPDGLAEFSYAINQRGALTVNWAGSPSSPADTIFGHLPLTNIIDIGWKAMAVKEYGEEAKPAYLAAWHDQSASIQAPSGGNLSTTDFFLNEVRVADGTKTEPIYAALGLTGQRFYGKLDEAFAVLSPAERRQVAALVRDQIISRWTSDESWWTSDDGARKDRAKAELPALVETIALSFKAAFPEYAGNAELMALFDATANPWKSSLHGLYGLMASPISKAWLAEGGPALALTTLAEGPTLVALRSSLLHRSLALDFSDALTLTCPPAILEGGEAFAPLVKFFKAPQRVAAAIASLQDFDATKEATLAACAAADIDTEARVNAQPKPVSFLDNYLLPMLDKREEMHTALAEKLATAGGKRPELETAVERVRDLVDGKLALVGAAATGLGDTMPTPLHENFPGPGVHSNVFNTLVQGIELQSTPVTSLLIGILFAVAICFVAARFNVISGVVTFAVLIVAYIICDLLIQDLQRGFLDTTRNMGALFMPFLSIQVFRYAVEYRAKLKIKGQFAKFLSPQAVEQIQKNPDALKLGGDEAEMCVYFSDIAGFTPISESMSAPRLIDWLNAYMTRMCEPIRASDGYVDKFIGDAVMAFWGKPNPCTDYSARGCKAAIAVKHELKKWNRESAERGIPEAGTRIGLATGPFVVGNMGTEWKINFTAIGDTVNTGARLEGANKQYGTQIMINQLCYEQAKDVILAHPLDLIAVKGKKKGVAVYHLISTTDIAEPDHVKGAKIYTEAFEAYQRQEWKVAHEGFLDSKQFLPPPYLVAKGPYDQMMERCQHLMDANIQQRMEILGLKKEDEEWDGVWRLTSK